nr:Chain B, peptide from serine acetyltransferase [Salmonella enterica subsp. enterica serovar Typhimurium]7YOI_B Chain B, peptide from serine acetyltransferase [Salmonella enterica subsp. enterica serovar Typhimurium]7YOM_B Chain B, peptide from serine acetyltransferase [Salmonella enterica subsp. enterica serovar Typhimurium]
IGDGYEFT